MFGVGFIWTMQSSVPEPGSRASNETETIVLPASRAFYWFMRDMRGRLSSGAKASTKASECGLLKLQVDGSSGELGLGTSLCRSEALGRVVNEISPPPNED